MDIQKNLENIFNLTDLVIQTLGPLSGIRFGLNIESVEWVDGFIERQRRLADFDQNKIEGLVNTLGSFLGEALRTSAGGKWSWIESQQTIGLLLPGGGVVFPFNKVRKQLVNGAEAGDSIAGFYSSTLTLQASGLL